jgi:hypothetical protein
MIISRYFFSIARRRKKKNAVVSRQGRKKTHGFFPVITLEEKKNLQK